VKLGDDRTNAVFVRSHIERCLEEAWNVFRVQADADGDYCFRSQRSACYVHVAPDGQDVRVVGLAAHGVRPTAKLLKEINDLNAHCRAARVVLVDDHVHVAQTLPAAGCTPDTMKEACEAVSKVADDVGVVIAAMFDGSTPFSGEEEESGAEAE
jgi:hypothetical protein